MMNIKKCVLCGSNQLTHYKDVRDDNYFYRNKLPVPTEKFHIVKCLNCSMVFVQNPLNPSHYFLPEQLDKEILESPPPSSKRHWYILSLLQSIKKEKQEYNLLEVDCGFGQLLYLAQGIGYNCVGIEPSSVRAEYVAKSLKLKVFNANFNEFINTYPKNQFDVIILDNILEHIVFPNNVIRPLSCILSAKGICICIVPNLSDIRRWIFPGWAQKEIYQPVGHVNYFTAKTLKKIFGQNGFDPIKIKSTYKNIPFLKIKLQILDIFRKEIFGIVPFGLYFTYQKNNN